MVPQEVRCFGSGPNHDQVKPHSSRIAGATLLFAAGVTADEIKTMGRWIFYVYRIYCRWSKERLLGLLKRMSNPSSTQFLNGAGGFMELLEVEPVEAEAPPSGTGDDQQPDATEEVGAETGDEADEQEAKHEVVASSDDETGWLKELSERGATLTPKARDSIEQLFAEEDSDQEPRATARARRKGGTQSARTKSPAVGSLGPEQLCQPVGREVRQANSSDNKPEYGSSITPSDGT